ncbi:MAG: ABC transporter ATP-binding protein [Thaumarchaeota archaeon]|nr:MAG: ABC transporter ATP-binding protein [Nitrososphaerota archaeon]
MAIIEARRLTRVYDGLTAVDHIDLEVEEGEIFGFLGPNGAGKTTTIKMLTTLLRPSEGEARICGYDVVRQPSSVRKVIGVVFQEPALDDRLTGWENLDFHARLYGLDRREREERIEEVLELVGLKDRADELVENYSGGMKRRLEIARGLIHWPRVLFLDEPTLGLDVQTRRAIWEYVLKLNRVEGITVFLTTHYMEEADYLSHRVAIIDHGKILAVDKPKNLKDMIGGDIVIVSCSDPKPLARELGESDWVKEVKVRGGEVNIYVDLGEEKIPDIIMMAERLGVEIESVTLRKPTLEDVYLHFTGRRIREEEASVVEKMRNMRVRRGWRR